MFGVKTPQYINGTECGNCEFTYDREMVSQILIVVPAKGVQQYNQQCSSYIYTVYDSI